MLNAENGVFSALGGAVSSLASGISRAFASIFTSESAPLKKIWTSITDLWDAVVNKIKGWIDEKPVAVFSVGLALVVAVIAIIIFGGPAIVGKFVSGVAKAVGDTLNGVLSGVKRIFRRR